MQVTSYRLDSTNVPKAAFYFLTVRTNFFASRAVFRLITQFEIVLLYCNFWSYVFYCMGNISSSVIGAFLCFPVTHYHLASAVSHLGHFKGLCKILGVSFEK